MRTKALSPIFSTYSPASLDGLDALLKYSLDENGIYWLEFQLFTTGQRVQNLDGSKTEFRRQLDGKSAYPIDFQRNTKGEKKGFFRWIKPGEITNHFYENV